MKKVFLLLLSSAILFAFGCGSGGDTTTTGNTSNPAGEPIAANMGRIAVSFGTQATQADKVAQAVTADHGRVVVRKWDYVHVEGVDPDTEEPYSYDVFTMAFQGISDGAIPGDVYVQVPAGGGYQVDVLTYKYNVDGKGLNAVLKYSTKSDVNVTAGQDNVITMPALADCLPSDAISYPNPVESGLTYDLRKGGVWNYAQPIRNDGKGFVKGSLTAFTNDWFSYDTSNKLTTAFVPPAYAGPGLSDYYIQGQFFIDLGLLKDSEAATWFNWACHQTVATKVSPPTTIKITF